MFGLDVPTQKIFTTIPQDPVTFPLTWLTLSPGSISTPHIMNWNIYNQTPETSKYLALLKLISSGVRTIVSDNYRRETITETNQHHLLRTKISVDTQVSVGCALSAQPIRDEHCWATDQWEARTERWCCPRSRDRGVLILWWSVSVWLVQSKHSSLRWSTASHTLYHGPLQKQETQVLEDSPDTTDQDRVSRASHVSSGSSSLLRCLPEILASSVRSTCSSSSQPVIQSQDWTSGEHCWGGSGSEHENNIKTVSAMFTLSTIITSFIRVIFSTWTLHQGIHHRLLASDWWKIQVSCSLCGWCQIKVQVRGVW